jgi:glycosyltransferase involved in cell wall biosynthesis
MVTKAPTHNERHKFIVMVSTAAKGGMRSVVEAYRRDGLFERYHVRLLFSHDDGPIWTRLRLAAVAIATCLIMLLRKQVAVFHLHVAMYGSFWRKALIARLATAFRVPVIMHLHGSQLHTFIDQQPRWRKQIIRSQLESCAAVLVLSKRWEQFVLAVAPRAHVIEMPNYVPVPKHTRQSSSRGSECVFFFSGRVGSRKGVFDLLPAFRDARRSLPDIRLRIAGDGELEKAAFMTRELGLEDCVDLLGWLSASEIQKELDEADVFVLPSHNEGLPMSLLEAMARGLPVVSTRVGGIPEIVLDGVNGLLIEAGNVEALARSIISLAGDPSLRTRLGESAQETVRMHYSVEKLMPRLQHIYDSILSPGLRRGSTP